MPKANDRSQTLGTAEIEQGADETDGEALARALLAPALRHGVVASAYASQLVGTSVTQPTIADFVAYVKGASNKASEGDMALASRMLASQAITLDAMFTEFARRAAATAGQHLDATERYARMAMKAQANSRSTLEALAKLHQPREQTVRHVHVSEGGQAIVADQFHQHTGGQQIAETVEQSHATGATGARASLPCPNPQGDGVPISSGQGAEPMPHARRDEPGIAEG